MADNTTTKTKTKERTFKDDVLSLVSKGNEGDSFDYYVVSLHDYEDINKIKVFKKAMLLKNDKEDGKTLVDCSYHTLYSNKRFTTYAFRLNKSSYRRAFVVKYYLNLVRCLGETIEECILFSKSKHRLASNCKIYFLADDTSKKEIENKIVLFNREYLKRGFNNTNLPLFSLQFLFYCVFFNEYSNIGLLDNFCSCFKQLKIKLKEYPMPLENLSENDIKEIISKEAKKYHKMQEGMDLITSNKDTENKKNIQ